MYLSSLQATIASCHVSNARDFFLGVGDALWFWIFLQCSWTALRYKENIINKGTSHCPPHFLYKKLFWICTAVHGIIYYCLLICGFQDKMCFILGSKRIQLRSKPMMNKVKPEPARTVFTNYGGGIHSQKNNTSWNPNAWFIFCTWTGFAYMLFTSLF